MGVQVFEQPHEANVQAVGVVGVEGSDILVQPLVDGVLDLGGIFQQWDIGGLEDLGGVKRPDVDVVTKGLVTDERAKPVSGLLDHMQEQVVQEDLVQHEQQGVAHIGRLGVIGLHHEHEVVHEHQVVHLDVFGL